MTPPTVSRETTPGSAASLEALRYVARLLDSAFVLPGTTIRIGLDPVVGLVPGVGDLVSPVFTAVLVWQARRFAVPRAVQMRMVLNAAIDAVIGTVPLLGDVFDVAWRSNERNVALLERHALQPRPASAADWAFVAGMLLLVAAAAALPFVLLGALAAILVSRLSGI